MKNAYSAKYEAAGAGSESSVSAISIGACERAISIVLAAKKAQGEGDQEGWVDNLNKVHQELATLMQALENDEKYADIKDEKLDFYFFLGLKAGLSKMEFSHPDRADQLIEKLQETRDFWIKQSKDVTSDAPSAAGETI